jgi:peptide/nickel transport system substrate-binding protein
MLLRPLAVLVVAVLAFAAPARAADDTLHLFVATEPSTLQPLLSTDRDTAEVAGLMFDSLVRYDGANVAQPVLASRVPTQANGDISADGLRVTVRLRHGVRWHDGAPFTAADVVFTMRTILDPRNPILNRSLYTGIADVRAADPATVVFRLSAPQASFVSNVLGGYPIVPEHLLAKSANLATDPFNAHPVGTGPYRLVRWLRGDHVEFDANPDYVLGAPKLAHVRVAVVPDTNTQAVVLKRGEADFGIVQSSVYGQFAGVTTMRRTTEPTNDVNMFAMNETRPPLNDRAVRRAIALAVDRKRISDTVSFGTGVPAYGDLPLFMYGGRPPAGWDRVDADAARAMLDRDGWRTGSDGMRARNGTPLQLTLIDISGSASGSQVDLQLMQTLRDLGIAVDYKTFVPAIFYAPASQNGPVQTGAFDMAYIGWSGGNDPNNGPLYRCGDRIPHGNNSSAYCNPAMDRLLQAEQRTYDVAARDRIVAQIERLAVADNAYLYLYHTPWRIIENPRLQRPPASIGDYWYGIERWSFAP